MPAVQYPFIDVAVHENVRDHFAAGDAVVLFSPDLQAPLWANGAGAGLFGYSSIYDFLDQGPNRADVAFRQIEAASRQLREKGDVRHVTIRVASGFQRVVIQARCALIEVHGQSTVLFSAAVEARRLNAAARAARMIEGFDDPETHMAVLGADGEIVAASSGFAALEISPQTARSLTGAASTEPSRLIKRPIPTIKGYLPAAIGMPSDDPALFLLFTVDTTSQGVAGSPAPSEDEQTHETAIPAPDGFADAIDAVADIEEADEPGEEISLVLDAPAQTELDAEDTDGGTEHLGAPDNGELSEGSLSVVEPATLTFELPAVEPQSDRLPVEADRHAALPDAEAVVADVPAAEEVTAVDALPEPEAVDTAAPQAVQDREAPLPDATELTAEDLPANAPVAEPVLAEGFVFQRDSRAIRFVWKIDGEGQFTEVSKEFAAAVGPHAADVVGMAFSDLAALFHLDPDGKITELLNKRDTWSGKTIWWPVEGTSLTVPVDLAALPTYTRTREFDGFRGFGIVRIADASEDPHAVGLSLMPQGHAPGPERDAVEDIEGEDIGGEDPRGDMDDAAIDGDDQPSEQRYLFIAEEPTPDESVADLDALARESELQAAADDQPETDTSEPAGESVGDDEASAEPASPAASAGDATIEGLDWPAGERPALRLVPTAGRRYSDKIIQLEEHRSRLSPGEQAAFREIARQLDRFIGRDDEPATDKAADPAAPLASLAEQPDADHDDKPLETAQQDGFASGESMEAELQDEPPAHDDAVATDVEQPAVPATPEAAEDAVTADEVFEEPAADVSGVSSAAADTEAEPAGEDVEAGRQTAAPDAPIEAEADAQDEVQAEAQESLSDLQLLSQMIPVRERIGLSPDIIDQMPVALLVHNGDHLIHGNPEFLKLTGYASIEELSEVGGLDALLQRQDLEDKTTEASGMVVVRANDEIIPVSARLQSVRWGDATALMLALMPVSPAAQTAPTEPGDGSDAAAMPVPARRADQTARLQVEVEELRAILETATDGVVIIDDTGEIRSMNRAASGLFNYDNEEINGRPFVVLFAHESQKAIVDYLAGLAGHGVASVLNDGREVIGREASGGFLPLFMTIGKLTSSNGYCAVIRDITQWKRTEEELRTAKRAAETANAHKSDFLAHVSHEIRTPLNAIIGFADMMASERFGPIGHPRYIEYANDINRSGRHVLDIVNDLLDISKIEAGEMELDFIAVGLNETVSEAVSLVQPQANNQRVIIRTALSNSVPPVVADIRSIKQIVLNILSNAIRFTPSGGQIVVSTAYDANGTVALRIRDTGIGMTRAELELAMKPFRQVAGTARKRGDGTGLGLPLTKAMVDANRASFSISSAPNEGTLVEITFPPQRVLAN